MHRWLTAVAAAGLLVTPEVGPVGPMAAQTPTPAADSAEAAAAIASLMEDWFGAYERGEVEALAELFAADGIYAANTGEVLRGRDGIGEGVRGWLAKRPAFFAAASLDESAALDVEAEPLRFRTAGDAACVLSRFVVRVIPPGCLMDAGHFLSVWRQEPGRTWLLESLLVNQDRGEPPSEACLRPRTSGHAENLRAALEALAAEHEAAEAATGEARRPPDPEGVRLRYIDPGGEGTMEALRTPDERFASLPDYPFEPRYATVDGLRIHYVDEGPRDATPVVLLHGEPSWSYLYRKMIPALAGAGHRVVAPDLVGFGRSDKPAERSSYTARRHVAWMRSLLLDELGLENITLFGQDWGGIIGFHLVAEHPERFACIVAANTALPTGEQPRGEAFLEWQRFSQEVPELPIGPIVQLATVTELPPEVVAAYDAPFPDERYKAGARVFPMLVPTSPEHPGTQGARAAWEALSRWEKPFLTLFSDSDPITGGAELAFQERVPGARGQPHRTIEGAGHFLQEDRGEEIARLVNELIARNGCAE